MLRPTIYPFNSKVMILPKPIFDLKLSRPKKEYPFVYCLNTLFPLRIHYGEVEEGKFYRLAHEMADISRKIFRGDNRKKLVAICGGTYDVLHLNHLVYLHTIALIVGGPERVIVILDSDEYCRLRKGKLPLVPEKERLRVLCERRFDATIIRSGCSIPDLLFKYSSNGRKKMIHFRSEVTKLGESPNIDEEFLALKKIRASGVILPRYDITWKNGEIISSTNIRKRLNKNKCLP